jgi:predicted nucleic acid-binding protein
MARSPEAYVDTSALIAFADRSDTHHPLFRRLFSDPPALLTSALVLAEGHGWFLRRYDVHRALQFLAMIEEMDFLSTAAVGRREMAGASILLRRFSDQALTLVDAVGLQLMKERSIRLCWSTDFHLGLTGATLVVNAAE